MELIPLPAVIQKDIIPVVCLFFLALFSPSHLHKQAQANNSPPHTVQLPFWSLVSFGAWLLFRLGYGLLTFRDTPEAYAELMDEIKLAKADLRAKGVDVD